jgi:hypothetical protein
MRKLLMIGLLIICACNSARLINIDNGQLPTNLTGDPYKREQVKAAILKACSVRGWIPTVQRDGSINAAIVVRGKHEAKVKITYTQSTVNIIYLDSENLNYENGTIHRNYNKWVANLYQTITKELSANAQPY